NACDIAVSLPETPGHTLDQCGRRRVGDEIGRHFKADVVSRRGITRQNIDGLVNFGKTSSKNRVSEKVFQAVIVALRVELEKSVADIVGKTSESGPLWLCLDIDAEPGQDARKLLDVLLGVAGAHPHRVQLHDLARIIFVEVTVG